MELILLQTKALLLGPRMSDANGMLLKEICREKHGKKNLVIQASFCGLGPSLPLSWPFCHFSYCDSYCDLAFALTCLSTSSQTLVFCLLPEGLLASRMSVLLLVGTP